MLSLLQRYRWSLLGPNISVSRESQDNPPQTEILLFIYFIAIIIIIIIIIIYLFIFMNLSIVKHIFN